MLFERALASLRLALERLFSSVHMYLRNVLPILFLSFVALELVFFLELLNLFMFALKNVFFQSLRFVYKLLLGFLFPFFKLRRRQCDCVLLVLFKLFYACLW